MFRCLERRLLTDSQLSRNDFVDFPALVRVLQQAGDAHAETPLHRLAQIWAPSDQPLPLLLTNGGAAANVPAPSPPGTAVSGNREEVVVSRLEDVLRHHPFQHEPVFAALKLRSEVAALLHASLDDRILGAGDQYWLNRHLVDTAFREATGQACFIRPDGGLGCVLVSDVGKPIQVEGRKRAGGVIRTSVRASSILMDRVWQLEKETFHDAPGFVFAVITDVVEPSEDATAMHPEVQRQTANIRTDLDRFTPLEISSLVRHGYCVGRKTCRTHPEVFGAELPDKAPWDPISEPQGAALLLSMAKKRLAGPARQAAPATTDARTLQKSAFLRIWGTLLDYRDWTSYVYVPLLIPILVLLPYFIFKAYQRSQMNNEITESLAQGSRDLEHITRLLEHGPVARRPGEPAEEVSKLEKPDFSGVELLQDSFIADLRRWKPTVADKDDPTSVIHHYRRLKIAKKPETKAGNVIHWPLLVRDPGASITFPRQQLQPILRKSFDTERTVSGEKPCHWQLTFDLQKVPVGDLVDLMVEYHTSGPFAARQENSTAVPFKIMADTAELTMWILMPEGREYANFRILRHKAEAPDKVESVRVVTEYLASNFRILAFKLLSLKAGDIYEVGWTYK